MTESVLDRRLQELATRIVQARFVLVFTGAGISTGSGIPDFRGPQGLWKTWQPVYYDEFLASPAARKRHWDFKLESWRQFRDARPNPAHRALVQLEHLGRLHCLVTQNIDGLHQQAGSSEDLVIELHGTNRVIECVDCGRRYDPDPIFAAYARTREVPLCTACGGFLKPATVMFGQPMPEEAVRRALDAAARSDLVMAVGSSLEVYPAASVPLTAKRHGAFYAILNLGPTAQDHACDLRLEGDVVALLPRLAERVAGHLERRTSLR
ncbi:MAG: NAD-dependent protein deacetylase [Acidobacteriota bacterium]